MPVPSKATIDGSLDDLKRKNTEEDMMAGDLGYRYIKHTGVVEALRRFEGTRSHTLQRADAEKVVPRTRYSIVDIHAEKKNDLSLWVVQD